MSLHTAGTGERVASVAHKGAVLDVVGGGGAAPSSFFSGGLDMAVLRHDLSVGVGGSGGGVDVLGSHAGAVRCVERSDAHGAVVTGSWDKTAKVWDPRSRGGSGGGAAGAASGAVATLALPDKCYAMALLGDHALLVGTAGRHVQLYDLRRLAPLALAAGGSPEGALMQGRDSSLKHQTRCLQALPDASGFTTGSIEGRVAVDYVDMAPAAQERKYAFKVRRAERARTLAPPSISTPPLYFSPRPPPPLPPPLPATQCHRQKSPSGDEKIFPVNAISFHPTLGTFATGGGDGVVCVWDHALKKRVSQLPGCGGPSAANSVASLAFSPDGSLLAVAASYAWEQGDPAQLPQYARPAPDTVYIRQVADAEVRPKTKA